jgi:predicted DNA-binding transcriptional regulator YafY
MAHLAARPLTNAQQVEPLPTGGARLRARVSGLWAAADWVIGWGGEVRVVAPAALVDQVRHRARATLAAMGETT